MPDVSVAIAGLRLRNPVMLAAGVLGLSGSMLRFVAESGAGAVVTKSIGLKPRAGYPNPTIVEVEGGLINALGLPNPGAYDFIEEVKVAKGGGAPVIASVYGGDPSEYASVALMMEEAGADAVELNLSCPHVAEVAQHSQDPKLTYAVVREVRRKVSIPVIAKLSAEISRIVDIAKAAKEAGADAVTAINTVRAMSIDLELKKPILFNKIGGLSGPAIKAVAVRCVYEIYEAVDVPIIGVGGIAGWRDAVEFLLAGARAIQVGSAVAFKGLGVFNEVVKGLEGYLKANGFKNVGDVVGLAHRGL